jgi:hypothetical protein
MCKILVSTRFVPATGLPLLYFAFAHFCLALGFAALVVAIATANIRAALIENTLRMIPFPSWPELLKRAHFTGREIRPCKQR